MTSLRPVPLARTLLVVSLLACSNEPSGNNASPNVPLSPKLTEEPLVLDKLPNILYSVDRAGNTIAILDHKDTVMQDEFFRRVPLHLDNRFVVELAEAANHFSRKFMYEVIADPAAFEQSYRKTLSTEDPTQNWQQGNPRLTDFGVPNFLAIHAPVFINSRLVFYAKSVRLGVPYRVEVEIDEGRLGEASYEPLPMGR